MITKNINKCLVAAFLIGCGSVVTLSSCEDMLETESTRQNIEPSINQKTDSVFYAFGILQAMQQVADQYVLQGEMRGDLVKTTLYTDNNLRQLANFSATTANRYDSAYVYYRIINNCNYFIAHCDTNLYNGATNVIIDKYIAAKSIRAWAYLQLGRNYEKVPFFTEPLTMISQIDRGYPELTLSQIVNELKGDLEQYTGAKVPTLGYTTSMPTMGRANWEGSDKQYMPSRCFIPVDVVLGDMYLEVGDYDAAARHYITYFTKASEKPTSFYLAPMASKYLSTGFGRFADEELPDRSQISDNITSPVEWSDIFSRDNYEDIITYIPMATTAQNGYTTQLPLIFGFDYYATPEEKKRSGQPYVNEIQLLPSDALNTLSDSTEYYYYAFHTGQIDKYDSVRAVKIGDMRMRSIIHQEQEGDSVMQWIDKYKNANVVLYRNSTIWLRLAEAFNRLGMPDAAFAILKDGISEKMLTIDITDSTYQMKYLSNESRKMLTDTYQLLTTNNLNTLFTTDLACGIHNHGAGKAASDFPKTGQAYKTNVSPYQYGRMVGLKLQELGKDFSSSAAIGTTKLDTINAIEDLICDEYALETAFEGNRYFDLMRLARHKNGHSGTTYDGSPAGYGANFGYKWLGKKLEGRGWSETKMYLPFK